MSKVYFFYGKYYSNKDLEVLGFNFLSKTLLKLV